MVMEAKYGEPDAPKAEDKVKDDVENEAEELREQLAEARAKAQRFDAMNGRYLKDQAFKEQFDALWEGRKLEREVARVESSVNGADIDPTDLLKGEVEKSKQEAARLQQRLDALEGTYAEDKITGERKEISYQYKDAFNELAEKAGYEEGTEAYSLLFTKTTDEGYNIARELGLNHPLQQYNPKIVKKAFEKTMDLMKKAGFDDAWQKRQQALKKTSESSEKQSDGPGLDKFFTKERLKTRGGAAKAMEEAFRARFNTDDLKM